MDNQTQSQTPPQITPPPQQQPQLPEHSHIMGVLCYLGILVLIPLIVSLKDDFIKFHAKQGILLLAIEVIAMIISPFPVFGWLGAALLWLLSFILIIVGVMNVLNKQQRELPLIGHYAKYLQF